MGADPVGRSFRHNSHRNAIEQSSASAAVRSVNREDPRREYGAKPFQHATENSAQREHRLMSHVINKVGGEQRWKSLNNNPAAQWKIIRESLPREDYNFLVKTAKDRKAHQPAVEPVKKAYVREELYIENKQGWLVKRNTAVVVGVRKDGSREPIAASEKKAIGPVEISQKTEAANGYQRKQGFLGIPNPFASKGEPTVAARVVDRVAHTGNPDLANQPLEGQRERGRSGNAAQMTREQAAEVVRKYFKDAGTTDYDTLIERLQASDKQSRHNGKPTNYEQQFRAVLAVRDGKAPQSPDSSAHSQQSQKQTSAAPAHNQNSRAKQSNTPAQMTREQAAEVVRKYFKDAGTTDFDTLIERLQASDKQSRHNGKPTNYEQQFRAVLAIRDGKAALN